MIMGMLTGKVIKKKLFCPSVTSSKICAHIFDLQKQQKYLDEASKSNRNEIVFNFDKIKTFSLELADKNANIYVYIYVCM